VRGTADRARNAPADMHVKPASRPAGTGRARARRAGSARRLDRGAARRPAAAARPAAKERAARSPGCPAPVGQEGPGEARARRGPGTLDLAAGPVVGGIKAFLPRPAVCLYTPPHAIPSRRVVVSDSRPLARGRSTVSAGQRPGAGSAAVVGPCVKPPARGAGGWREGGPGSPSQVIPARLRPRARPRCGGGTHEPRRTAWCGGAGS
jgi:hypothetical protein